MSNGLAIALSNQLATRRQLEVIANNLANAATSAFKGERMMFVEHLARPSHAERLSFVYDRATALDLRPGSLSATGNPLDLAIKGDGWFVIDTPEGFRYSRDGHFRLDATGMLVTRDGHAVLTEDGDPIVFTPDDGDIRVQGDGAVSAGGQPRGRLALVAFDNGQELEKAAGNLYRSAAVPLPAADAAIVQGMIEGSNVQPVVEVTRMIDVLRSYQQTHNLINAEHERQRLAIRKLLEDA